MEVLTPDFKGYKPAINKVFEAGPEIFSHNIECIERISKKVRSQANWNRSLDVLAFSVSKGLRTKTGMMVGFGEKNEEIIFKYAPVKNRKKMFYKKNDKENPFGILKNLDLN